MRARRSRTILAITLLGLIGATNASAQGPLRDWGYRQAVLKVTAGGLVQGRAHGQWQIQGTSDGTKSHLSSLVQDAKPGGQPIYVHLLNEASSGYCVQPEGTSCQLDFYPKTSANTDRSSSGAYVRKDVFTPVDIYSNSFRAIVSVCEDVRFKTDPCSGGYITAADNL